MNDQTTITNMARIPFPFGWYSWELGEYRPFPWAYLTYWRFPYEALPPLSAPDPTFRYLAPPDNTNTFDPEVEASREWLLRRWATLTDSAGRLGITLPESFRRFMQSSELQACVWTGCCGFMLSDQVVSCPGFDGGYLVAFLRDQQDCIIWCLCFTLDGTSCVVAVPSQVLDAMPDDRSDALLGMREIDQIDGSEEAVVSGSDALVARDALWAAATASDGICICAPSFPAFIYRFWTENEIAMKLYGDVETPLTDAERDYLEHYARMRRTDG